MAAMLPAAPRSLAAAVAGVKGGAEADRPAGMGIGVTGAECGPAGYAGPGVMRAEEV